MFFKNFIVRVSPHKCLRLLCASRLIVSFRAAEMCLWPSDWLAFINKKPAL